MSTPKVAAHIPMGNLAEQVHAYLQERIIRFELAPGQRLLEAPLADSLGLSRGPVREALRMLEQDRLVELLPRRGAKVTEISPPFVGWLYDILIELFGILGRK